MNRSRILLLVATAWFALAIVACGGAPAPSQPAPGPEPAPEPSPHVALPADLAVAGLHVSPSPVVPGNEVTISFTITNTGETAAKESTTRVVLNTTATDFEQSWFANVEFSTPEIEAGESYTHSHAVRIPLGLATGEYIAWAIADANHTAGQDNYDNDIITQAFPISNKWVQVSVGTKHTLAVREDGTVWAWGSNENGQLGTSDPTLVRREPERVSDLQNITQVAAGNNHSLALDTLGNVRAWGQNFNNELGDDSKANRTTPQIIDTLPSERIVSISSNAMHSLALDTNGAVWAWGGNQAGAVGNGIFGQSASMTELLFSSGVVAISSNSNYSLALDEHGSLWA